MAQVAQAYFHFHTNLSPKELRKFGRQIDRAATRAATNSFETDVLINVDIEEGSLIGRVTAYAAMVALYTGLISDYKGVKESVKDMYSDARAFGDAVVSKAIEYSGVSDRQVYRTERRTKTVGKLGRFLNDIERLENSVNELSPAQMKRELARLNRELHAVANDLQPKERDSLNEILSATKLPPPTRWPVSEVKAPKAVQRPEQFELTYEPSPIEDRPERPRKRLRYQNSFEVRAKGKRLGEYSRSLLTDQ
jgi:hypothetical protein